MNVTANSVDARIFCLNDERRNGAMNLGYTWYHTNRRPATSTLERLEPQENTYTVRRIG